MTRTKRLWRSSTTSRSNLFATDDIIKHNSQVSALPTCLKKESCVSSASCKMPTRQTRQLSRVLSILMHPRLLRNPVTPRRFLQLSSRPLTQIIFFSNRHSSRCGFQRPNKLDYKHWRNEFLQRLSGAVYQLQSAKHRERDLASRKIFLISP